MSARVVLALAATLWASPLRTSARAQVASPRTVLTIHSGAETFPANSILDAGIREALASRTDFPIDYYAEYLESDLFPGEEASLAFKDYIRRKYHTRRIDVVLAMTDVGLRFALDHRGELFPDAPIVFSGLAAPDDITRDAGGGLTGIKAGVAYAETLKLALQLHPSTQRVFVVAKGPDARTVESVRAELDHLPLGVSLTYLNEQTVPLLLSAVRAVPRGNVILYIWYSQEDPGNVVYADEVARLVARAATVPVYGTSDFYIGSGIVGGVMRRTRETGTRIGQLALRILAGTRPQDIPIETEEVLPIIDWRQAQRWNIAPSRLPAGSQIVYREPSVLKRYPVYIVAATTVLLAQAALIAGLFFQRTKRREAEQQVRRSVADLRKSYERVRSLGSRLLNAQEGERSWIARELHDDIGQQLAVLNIDLALLGRTIDGRAGTMAAEAMNQVNAIIKSVRDLSHRLHPARLQLLGLVPALQGLQSELSQPHLTITFTHGKIPPTLAPNVTLCLFRIVQEVLQNALKYSGAHHVSVDLRRVGEGIALTIVDDGVGFDVDAAWGKGLGLISVSERVEAIGGKFGIRSSPGAGTRLEVNVPVSIAYQTETVAAS
jgi:signal transduction histidine kinase